MKQHKAFGILSSVITIAWACSGCSSGGAPVVPTSPATRLSDTALHTLQPTDAAVPTITPVPTDLPVSIITPVPTDAPVPTIAPQPPRPVEGQSAGQPQTPITTKLLMSHVPLLQETAELTMTVSATSDASDITAVINLPDGAALVAGEATWQGQLEAGQSQTLKAAIVFHSEGDWILEAKALSPQANGDVWGDASYIYLHVAENASHLGFEPDNNFTDTGIPDTPPPAVYPAPPAP